MKKTPFLKLYILILTFSVGSSYCQEPLRDTALFKEHQVIFEKMEYIPSEGPVKLVRTLNEETAGIEVLSDPYWISCLVSNKEYKEYLNAIESMPIQYQTALPPRELFSIKVEPLNITYKEYFESDKYTYYPVLGISWNQARLFCAWKTKQVNKELSKANLPHEKQYRLPLACEIEGAKHFMSINMPRVLKENRSYNASEIIRFNNSLNEWTLESFYESTYLNEISFNDTSPEAVIYLKTSTNEAPYRNKGSHHLTIGFRYAQTYRKVPNSY